jgi:hypothetical protein
MAPGVLEVRSTMSAQKREVHTFGEAIIHSLGFDEIESRSVEGPVQRSGRVPRCIVAHCGHGCLDF